MCYRWACGQLGVTRCSRCAWGGWGAEQRGARGGEGHLHQQRCGHAGAILQFPVLTQTTAGKFQRHSRQQVFGFLGRGRLAPNIALLVCHAQQPCMPGSLKESLSMQQGVNPRGLALGVALGAILPDLSIGQASLRATTVG